MGKGKRGRGLRGGESNSHQRQGENSGGQPTELLRFPNLGELHNRISEKNKGRKKNNTAVNTMLSPPILSAGASTR